MYKLVIAFSYTSNVIDRSSQLPEYLVIEQWPNLTENHYIIGKY